MHSLSFIIKNFPQFSQHLNQDKLCIIPTDTLYGFSGNAFSVQAIQAVENQKKRTDNPFILLFPNLDSATVYAEIPNAVREYFLRTMQEPTTFLVKKKHTFPRTFFPQFSEIALRIPQSKVLQEFLSFHKTPIFSTSVNISGFPPYTQKNEIQQAFKNQDDIMFAEEQAELPSIPSRIVRITEDTIEVLR